MIRVVVHKKHFLPGLLFLLGQIVVGCAFPIALKTTPEATPTPTPIALAPRGEQAGVITAVRGNVAFQALDAQTADAPSAFQVIGYGTTLHVAAQSSITIVCYNDHVYQISEQTTITLLPENCSAGLPLPAGSADQIIPQNGRIHIQDGSKIAEGETRAPVDDLGRRPIVLIPRDTKLMTATATIAWTEVSGAIRYQLHLLGGSPAPDVDVRIEDLHCAPNQATAPYQICSLAWPATWVLAPDTQYFLIVRVLTGIAQPWLPSDAGEFYTLAEAEHNKVAAVVDELQLPTLDATTQGLLTAAIYVEAGLFQAAIEQYQAILIEQPSVVALIALGDLHLEIDLPFFAIWAYQDALTMLEQGPGQDPILQAAADFGLGLAYYKQQNYALAEPYFLQAIELYSASDAPAETEFARQRLLETQARLP